MTATEAGGVEALPDSIARYVERRLDAPLVREVTGDAVPMPRVRKRELRPRGIGPATWRRPSSVPPRP